MSDLLYRYVCVRTYIRVYMFTRYFVNEKGADVAAGAAAIVASAAAAASAASSLVAVVDNPFNFSTLSHRALTPFSRLIYKVTFLYFPFINKIPRRSKKPI